MRNRFLMRSACGLVLVAAASAQTAGQPAFEVATIKSAAMPTAEALMKGGKMSMGMKVDGARVDIGFMSLADIVRQAYRVKTYQVSGPDWIQTARFDIQAKIPEGASTDQVPEM